MRSFAKIKSSRKLPNLQYNLLAHIINIGDFGLFLVCSNDGIDLFRTKSYLKGPRSSQRYGESKWKQYNSKQ